MSKATELARAEAERAEHDDHPDDDEQAEEEEQLPAEPEQVEREYPPEPTDEMFAAVRELNADHQAAVREVMGPFVASFVECDTCGGSGLTIPEPPAPELPKAPNTQRCPVCDGFGDLDTDSRKQGFTIIQCTNCNGKGWVGPANMPAEAAARAAIESVGGNGVQQPVAQQPAPAQPPADLDPRAAELRALGWTVVEPFRR